MDFFRVYLIMIDDDDFVGVVHSCFTGRAVGDDLGLVAELSMGNNRKWRRWSSAMRGNIVRA